MSIGGVGPNGFEPSQKQSIGVIQMQGISRSKLGFSDQAMELLSKPRKIKYKHDIYYTMTNIEAARLNIFALNSNSLLS